MFAKIYEHVWQTNDALVTKREGITQASDALVAEWEETQLQAVYAELKSSVRNHIQTPLPPPAHEANLDDVIQR